MILYRPTKVCVGKLGCKPVETHVEQNYKLGESMEDLDMWIDNFIKDWSGN